MDERVQCFDCEWVGYEAELEVKVEESYRFSEEQFNIFKKLFDNTREAFRIAQEELDNTELKYMYPRLHIFGDEITTEEQLQKLREPMFTEKLYCPKCGSEDLVDPDADPHVACYSYPNCDLAPLGCYFETDDPEPYGHRD